MEGTLQLVVNLRSKSVEYSSEKGEDRYSSVLKGDLLTAADIVKQVPDACFEEDDDNKVTRVVRDCLELAKYVGNLEFFSIIRFGNTVAVHPDDISYVTVERTGDLKDIENDR